MKKFYYTAGPSELYFSVDRHVRQAMLEGVPSIHHRSAPFMKIFQGTVEALKSLMQIPEEYEIVFLSSATEAMERIIQNTVDQSCVHFVNGAFSQRFFDYAVSSGKTASKITSPWGTFPEYDPSKLPEGELIGLTINETSTGVHAPENLLRKLKGDFPDRLIAVDIVSSAPVGHLDFNLVDLAFFSIQKGFGLPPGLGVCIISPTALAKANEVTSQKGFHSHFHSIPKLVEHARKFQTTETPNSLGIYLLGKVTEDMLTKGLEQIRREIAYKSAVLYNAIEQIQELNVFVEDPTLRSKTIIVAQGSTTRHFIDRLSKKGILISAGYGHFSDDQFRIANFPTHSKEQVEYIADVLTGL